MPWFWPFEKDEYSFDNSSLIEGVSDDTILLVLFSFSLIALWIYYSTRERNTTIHPDNQYDVENIRERAQQNAQTTSQDTPPTHIGRPRQDTCPICLTDSSVFSVETNCGHLFCGNCIITFWKYQTNWMNGMNCPVCRQSVTILLTCFTANEEALTDNPTRQDVVNNVKDFNRRFSGAPRSFREYLADIPVLIPHIFRQVFSIQGINLAYRVRMIIIFVGVILYILSPFDILSESALGFLGFFDDIFVLICAALYVIIIYREFVSRN